MSAAGGIRKGLLDQMTPGPRPAGSEGRASGCLGKKFPDRRSSKCKGLEAGGSWAGTHEKQRDRGPKAMSQWAAGGMESRQEPVCGALAFHLEGTRATGGRAQP